MGVFRPQDPLPGRQCPLVQFDGLLGASVVVVGIGQVVAGGQGIGVLRPQNPLPSLQCPLVEFDGLLGAPGLPVGVGEVVAGG